MHDAEEVQHVGVLGIALQEVQHVGASTTPSPLAQG
jgi:hypothetical protein